MDVNTASGGHISEDVPCEVLTELSANIASLSECTRLAANLGFKMQAILKWRESTLPVEMIAQDILLRWGANWSPTDKGKRSTLEQALSAIRKNLATMCRKMCEDAAK